MRRGIPAVARLIACTAVASIAAFATPAAQQSTTTGLTLPLTASGTTSRGTADVSGTVRVTQFIVLNNAVAAVATVVAHVNDPAAPTNVVTQVMLPVSTITATGQAGTTQQNFGMAVSALQGSAAASNGSATGTVFPSTSNGLYSPSFAGAPTATVIGPTGAATQITTTGAQSAQGACGPVHLEMGPLDINSAGLVVHLDRVVVDLTAPAATVLSNAAALGTAGSTAATAATTASTTASSFNSGLCSVAGLVGQGQANLQNLADLLNRVLSTIG